MVLNIPDQVIGHSLLLLNAGWPGGVFISKKMGIHRFIISCANRFFNISPPGQALFTGIHTA